jgi:hypothetical protein
MGYVYGLDLRLLVMSERAAITDSCLHLLKYIMIQFHPQKAVAAQTALRSAFFRAFLRMRWRRFQRHIRLLLLRDYSSNTTVIRIAITPYDILTFWESGLLITRIDRKV